MQKVQIMGLEPTRSKEHRSSVCSVYHFQHIRLYHNLLLFPLTQLGHSVKWNDSIGGHPTASWMGYE